MTQEFTKGVSARVSEQMFDEINGLASAEQRPISNMVRVLLTEALHYRKSGVTMEEILGLREAHKSA
jgi:hypothetical protein